MPEAAELLCLMDKNHRESKHGLMAKSCEGCCKHIKQFRLYSLCKTIKQTNQKKEEECFHFFPNPLCNLNVGGVSLARFSLRNPSTLMAGCELSAFGWFGFGGGFVMKMNQREHSWHAQFPDVHLITSNS